MKRDAIDFHEVPAHQIAMHERLENWGRSCFSGSGASTSPMFRLYRSEEVWSGSFARQPSIPVDQQDAMRISKGVHALPEPHMKALVWSYVSRGSLTSGRRMLGCTLAALHRYVTDARQMLVNRRV